MRCLSSARNLGNDGGAGHDRHAPEILWGSVPDHYNKASHPKVEFPSAHNSYVYSILSSMTCAIALCLKMYIS